MDFCGCGYLLDVLCLVFVLIIVDWLFYLIYVYIGIFLIIGMLMNFKIFNKIDFFLNILFVFCDRVVDVSWFENIYVELECMFFVFLKF